MRVELVRKLVVRNAFRAGRAPTPVVGEFWKIAGDVHRYVDVPRFGRVDERTQLLPFLR